MKNARVASISDHKARSFGILSVKFLKAPGWPVSIAHEVIYKNGKDNPLGSHKHTAEFVYVLKGTAKACLGNKTFRVKSGSYLVIPPGVKHRFVTGREPLVALSVFCPAMDWNNLDAVMHRSSGSKKRRPFGRSKRLPAEGL